MLSDLVEGNEVKTHYLESKVLKDGQKSVLLSNKGYALFDENAKQNFKEENLKQFIESMKQKNESANEHKNPPQ